MNTDPQYTSLVQTIDFKIVETLLSYAEKFYKNLLITRKIPGYSGIVYLSQEFEKGCCLGIETYKTKYHKIGYLLNGKYHSNSDTPVMIVVSHKVDQIILEEIRYYKNNLIHRDSDLPAYFSFFPDKSLRVLRYYKDGQMHRNPQNIQDKIISSSESELIDDFALEQFHQNGKIFQRRRYFNGILHNLINPCLYDYYDSGSLERIGWFANNEKHRKGKPALIEFYTNGDRARKMYFHLSSQGSVLYREGNKKPDVRYCEELKEI